MVLYSGGEKFCELWANIPECKDYLDYCSLLNYIEDCFNDHEITNQDFYILGSCLDHFAQLNGWEVRKEVQQDG